MTERPRPKERSDSDPDHQAMEQSPSVYSGVHVRVCVCVCVCVLYTCAYRHSCTMMHTWTSEDISVQSSLLSFHLSVVLGLGFRSWGPDAGPSLSFLFKWQPDIRKH